MDRDGLLAHVRATHFESGDRDRAVADARRDAAAAARRGDRSELASLAQLEHVFRNVYGSVLDPARMQSLEEQMPATLAAFREQVEAFLAWMLGQLPAS